MSSMRLVSLGFLLCMALMPSMLLTIASGHPDAATANVASVASSAGDGPPTRAWDGAAKSGPAATLAAPKEPAAADGKGVALVELYLSDADAAAMSREIESAAQGSLVLTFGTSQSKTAAGTGIDPYVGVEAGKRRRAYGRAVADGRESVGPVVVVSPMFVAGPDKPTSAWAKERVAAAAAIAPIAELTLKIVAAERKGAGAAWRVEFSAKGAKPNPALSDDAILNLLQVQPMGAETGAPMRVVSFKSFKLPRSGSGSVELSPPTGGSPTRLIAVLQHGKTMRTMATGSYELK